MLQSLPVPCKRLGPSELSEDATDYVRTLNGETDRSYRQNPIIDITIDPMSGRPMHTSPKSKQMTSIQKKRMSPVRKSIKVRRLPNKVFYRFKRQEDKRFSTIEP